MAKARISRHREAAVKNSFTREFESNSVLGRWQKVVDDSRHGSISLGCDPVTDGRPERKSPTFQAVSRGRADWTHGQICLVKLGTFWPGCASPLGQGEESLHLRYCLFFLSLHHPPLPSPSSLTNDRQTDKPTLVDIITHSFLQESRPLIAPSLFLFSAHSILGRGRQRPRKLDIAYR